MVCCLFIVGLARRPMGRGLLGAMERDTHRTEEYETRALCSQVTLLIYWPLIWSIHSLVNVYMEFQNNL